MWAGARARKNQASKRRETISGVTQRQKGTSSSSAGSSIPASSRSSRMAQARKPSGPSPSAGSTEPPGKTQAPGMKAAFSVRFSSRTSSARWACLPPRRRSTTEAAGRGVAGVPWFGASAGPRCLSIAPPYALAPREFAVPACG